MRRAIFFLALFLPTNNAVSVDLRIKTPNRTDELVLPLMANSTVSVPGNGDVQVEIPAAEFQRLLEGYRPPAERAPDRTFRRFEIEPRGAEPGALRRDQTIQMLSTIRPRPSDAIGQKDIESLIVRRDQIDPLFQEGITFGENNTAEVPLFARNSVVIKLADGITSEELDSLLQKYEFELLSVQAGLGTIHVRADLSKFMPEPSLQDSDPRLRSLRGLAAAANHYSNDPRIEAAAPDLIMRSHNLITPTGIVSNLSSETTDWGIDDVQAPALWNFERARDGAVIAILDAGFGRHEDLVFAQTPLSLAPGNHGTHVSGIACARHGNGAGLRGVLPNCFVIPKADPIVQTDGQDILAFMNLFSEIVADLNRIVFVVDGVRVFNISLGYNWRSNFGIDPEAADYKYVRDIVGMQGRVLLSVLENARDQDKVIYSAAGNDSNGSTDRRSARFASAFNWAAIEARSRGIASNGIIVEAHDRNGGGAEFSNDDGHISCPGVDVLSTVATDANNQPSSKSYGVMSGTSMASPYCAASHILFSLVRPGYSNLEVAECLIGSAEDRGTGTPHMRLSRALTRCPEKNAP